jgi:hypothetical protein
MQTQSEDEDAIPDKMLHFPAKAGMMQAETQSGYRRWLPLSGRRERPLITMGFK